MRVPRSILLGRAWPQPGEPLWLESDVEVALAWQAEQDALCPGCGHPVDEAWDERHMDSYEPRVMKCFACEAADERTRSINPEVARSRYVITEFDPRWSQGV